MDSSQANHVADGMTRFLAPLSRPPSPTPNVVIYVFPGPPHDERVPSTESLDQEIQVLDSPIAEAERAINLLQECRTALLSTAVTGKNDFREFANRETT